MHLALDVGNTESVIGLFEPGRLEVIAEWRISTVVPRTVDEFHLLLRSLLVGDGFDPSSITRVALGSVVPGTTDTLLPTLKRLTDGVVHNIRADSPLPIRLDVEEPRTVGPDRIANTLAASHLYGRDTIAVDLGTATTFDCITADAVFLGGVISPGLQAGQEWLARRTAKLPRVEFRPPDRVIGRRTEECLHSGIFYAALEAVDGTVRRIKEEWSKPDAYVVATGGFATTLGSHASTVDHIEPNLTLLGLELAGEHLDNAGEE